MKDIYVNSKLMNQSDSECILGKVGEAVNGEAPAPIASGALCNVRCFAIGDGKLLAIL